MKQVAIILADGFEELEAISVIDILRRGKIEVLITGLESLQVTGAHNIKLQAEYILNDLDAKKLDMIVLPGGLPGAEHLATSQNLQQLLRALDADNKFIGAICAAPWALKTAGVLKDKYTCYPSFEKTIDKSGYQADKNVVIQQNIITSRGPATAMEFALSLVKQLTDANNYNQVKTDLLA